MYHKGSLTQQVQKPPVGETPAWDVITHELISHLRSDFVKLTGARVAVEAVISSTAEGDAVTSLHVAALTPVGKEIVRYKLAPRPTGALACELAATISSAQLTAMPVDRLVSCIANLVDIHGSHYFVHNIPPIAIESSTAMHRIIPSFSAFARDPKTMDGQFIAERIVGDTRIRARARLYPEFKEAVIEANAYSHTAASTATVSHAFKVRCPDAYWRHSKTTAEVTAELMKLTWEALDAITADGPAAAHKKFSSPNIDDRIAHGVINPQTAEKNLHLPSGARVLLEVGDSVACIATQALGFEDSTMFSWVIAAKNGALSPEDTRLITARAAVEKLAFGTTKERKNAIATLDLMAHKAFKTPALESVVGYELADSLRHLNNTIARVGDPRSEARILDNLDGIQHVELVFRDPAYSRRRPQDPWLMSLGFGQAGDLKVELYNPLGNHLSVLLRAETVQSNGGIDTLSRQLVNLFDRQTAVGFVRLRALIEDLSSNLVTPSIDPERLLDDSKRMPLTRDIGSNRAYEIVAELAKVYQSVTGASISEVQVGRRASNQYDVAFCNQLGKNRVQLHLNVVPTGVSRVELIHDNSGVHEAESFVFTPALNVVLDQVELTGIFEDFNCIIAADDDATTSPLPTITSTRLYSRLKGHETPHTLSD